MSAILERCRLAGIRLRAEGTDLQCDAPKGALTPDLVVELRTHKPAILEALAHPDLLPPVARDPGPSAPGAREAEDLREFFEERAGIIEHDAGLPRPEAEVEAARITAILARNRGYLWASLRSALADYPALPSHLPATPGPVDALPFGVATMAVLPGRRVVRQGPFTGAQEVKA